MKLIHTILRILVFASALIISTAVLMTFLTKIPNDPAMIPWTQFISCFLEAAAAFVLSMALAYRKRGKPKSKDRGIATVLFGIYGCYVFVACLSAVFLFMTELNQKNVAATQADTTYNIAQDDYNRAKADYDRWDRLMTVEQQNVRPGRKFEEYKGYRDAAEGKMNEAKAALQSGSNLSEIVNNIQASFSAIFPTAWRELLITIFVIIMGFVYVLQVLTAWPLPLPGETEGEETATVKNKIATTPATQEATPGNVGLVLCGYSKCGNSFPYRQGKEYCDDSCRNAAFKERKRMERLEQSLGYTKPAE